MTQNHVSFLQQSRKCYFFHKKVLRLAKRSVELFPDVALITKTKTFWSFLMNKKLLPLAVAAIMAAPAAQASDLTVYGKAHLSLSTYDDSAAAGGRYNWDISSNASRLGVKGSEDLGNGLKAIFKMEMQVRMANNDGDVTSQSIASEGLSMRNSYVGLAGGWGTFLIGRHDTPMKISTGSLDLFGDTIADYNGNGADAEPSTVTAGLGIQDIRADSVLAYVSPNMNGLTIAAATITAGLDDSTNGADGSDLVEAYSVAAMYSNGPFFASLAYEAFEDRLIANAVADADEKWRLGLGYTANNFHVGFVYEDQEAQGGTVGNDYEIWQLSGSYTFGNNVLKAAYGERDGSGTNEDRDQWAIGLDHKMSKRTKVYAVYTDMDSSAASSDWSGFSAGMVHSF